MLTLKWKFLLLLLALILLVGFTKLPAFSSSGPVWAPVAFATHRNALKFFDQTSGKVYVYDEEDGKLRAIWQLDALGNDLKRVGSQKGSGGRGY